MENSRALSWRSHSWSHHRRNWRDFIHNRGPPRQYWRGQIGFDLSSWSPTRRCWRGLRSRWRYPAPIREVTGPTETSKDVIGEVTDPSGVTQDTTSDDLGPVGVRRYANERVSDQLEPFQVPLESSQTRLKPSQCLWRCFKPSCNLTRYSLKWSSTTKATKDDIGEVSDPDGATQDVEGVSKTATATTNPIGVVSGTVRVIQHGSGEV